MRRVRRSGLNYFSPSSERAGRMQPQTRFVLTQFVRLTCLLLVMAVAGCNDGTGSAGSGGAALSISGTPTTQVQPGQAYSFVPKASSANVSFSIQNKPAWATFSISTGQLSGTPTTANIGTYSNVVITASNGATSAALPSFTITVTTGGTVTLGWQAPTSNTNGTALTDLAGYIINYGQSATSLTQSVNIGTASTTSYTVGDLSAGTWYFALTAYTTDGLQSSLSSVVSMTVQ